MGQGMQQKSHATTLKFKKFPLPNRFPVGPHTQSSPRNISLLLLPHTPGISSVAPLPFPDLFLYGTPYPMPHIADAAIIVPSVLDLPPPPDLRSTFP